MRQQERRSIPFELFPRKFLIAIRGMENPRRGRKRYSKTSIASVINALGQYLFVVGRAGLPPDLSYDGIGLFIDDLDVRDLRNSSRLSYMSCIQALAKEVKYPAKQRRIILMDCLLYRAAMKEEVPTKIRKLAANPITLKDVSRAAVEARKQAYEANNDNRRRTFFFRDRGSSRFCPCCLSASAMWRALWSVGTLLGKMAVGELVWSVARQGSVTKGHCTIV